VAISLVASVSATPGSSGGASTGMTTTGATLIVVSVGSYGLSGATVTSVTDSKGNPYTGLTSRAFISAVHRWFYVLAPTVGAAHTVTVNGSGLIYPGVVAYAFAGVASYQTESGATAASGASLASGSVTPSEAGALILTGVCGQNAATDTVTPVGFTVTSTPSVGGVNMQTSAAWQVQGAAAAINPTWAFTPAQAQMAVGSAVFLPAAGGGGGGGGAGGADVAWWLQIGGEGSL
jgi:hypothetical protein